MQINRPLSNVLKNQALVRIIRYFLQHPDGEWSGREIARRAGVYQVAGLRALRRLSEEGIVTYKKIGRTHAYRLEKNHVYASILRRVLNEQEKIIPELFRLIQTELLKKGIKSKIVNLTLFGSMATGKDLPRSDVDLLIVVKNKYNRDHLDSIVNELSSKIQHKFGNPLSPLIYSENEIKNLRKTGKTIIRVIEDTGKLIYGSALREIK